MATKQEVLGGSTDFQPLRELRDSFYLIALTVASMGGVVGLGFLAVRLFAAR
ncbi:MAG: hypothetical protein ABR552_04700 [Actinomycetota bacterium]